jgi:hypothetical protein
MKAHTIKMFKMYWKAVRDGGDHLNEPEKCEDNENERGETSEDVDNPTSPRQQLAWMVRSETDSSETDDMTSHELDLGGGAVPPRRSIFSASFFF